MTFLIGWIACAIGVFCVNFGVSLLSKDKFTWAKYTESFFISSFIYGLIQVWIGG